MGKLLKLEFRKLTKQKSTYVCLGVMAIWLILSILLSKFILNNITDEAYVAPTLTSILLSGLSNANASLIIGIFIAIFVCEDYSEGTIKNIYSKGYTRTQVYFTKYIAVCLFSVASCLISWILSYLFGITILDLNGGFEAGVLLNFILQLLVILAHTSLFFLISMFLKKLGSSIAGCIVFPMIATLVLNMIDTILNLKNFSLNDYWLSNIFTQTSQVLLTGTNIVVPLVKSKIYIAAFTTIGVFVNNKKEN